MKTQEIAVTSPDSKGFTPEHGQGGLKKQTGTADKDSNQRQDPSLITRNSPGPQLHLPWWILCRPHMHSCHLLEEQTSETQGGQIKSSL